MYTHNTNFPTTVRDVIRGDVLKYGTNEVMPPTAYELWEAGVYRTWKKDSNGNWVHTTPVETLYDWEKPQPNGKKSRPIYSDPIFYRSKNLGSINSGSGNSGSGNSGSENSGSGNSGSGNSGSGNSGSGKSKIPKIGEKYPGSWVPVYGPSHGVRETTPEGDELDPDFRKRRREELKEEEEARKRRKKDKRHDINHIIKCSINSDTFKVWGIVLSIVVVVGIAALTLIYSYPVLLWEEFQCSVSTTTTQLPLAACGYSTLATPRVPSYKLSSRSYFPSSRKVVIRSFSQEDSKLDPNWVTGFIDGDGCFHISIVEDIKTKTSWRVRPHFQIGTHIKDIVLMEDIKKFFKVGSINLKHGSKSIMFRVQSIQ